MNGSAATTPLLGALRPAHGITSSQCRVLDVWHRFNADRGGTIALSNWTPDSRIGELFRIVSRHLPPVAGVLLWLQWRPHEACTHLFTSAARSIELYPRTFNFRSLLAEHFLIYTRQVYGPVQ